MHSETYICDISSNVFGIEVIQNNAISDKVSKTINEKVDAQIWATDFYNVIIDLSNKLTNSERVYFVRSLLSDYSEESISNELNISRNSLQKIKKSTLVKIYITFTNNENIRIN